MDTADVSVYTLTGDQGPPARFPNAKGFGPSGNHPFGLASELHMGQGNFGQVPHMTGDQGPPAGFPNAKGFGPFPSPHEDGDQSPGFANMKGYRRVSSPHGDRGHTPMQFNSLSPQ
jgi:hypothetical protein